MERADFRLASVGDFGRSRLRAAWRRSHQAEDDQQRYGQQPEFDKLQHLTSFSGVCQHGGQQCRAGRHVLQEQ